MSKDTHRQGKDTGMTQQKHYGKTKTNGDGYFTGQHTTLELDNEDGYDDNGIRTVHSSQQSHDRRDPNAITILSYSLTN
jgi:hypothetical protein